MLDLVQIINGSDAGVAVGGVSIGRFAAREHLELGVMQNKVNQQMTYLRILDCRKIEWLQCSTRNEKDSVFRTPNKDLCHQVWLSRDPKFGLFFSEIEQP